VSTVLVIDDEAQMCALVVDMMKPRGIRVVVGDHKQDIVEQIDATGAHVLLTDLRLPGVDGLALCGRVAEARPDVPVVVMTGFGSVENAIAAIRAGAYDFVTKPVEAEALALVLARAQRHALLKRELRVLRAAGDARAADPLLGESSAMRHVRDTVRQVADLDVNVLITGESGTGKEVVARLLHDSSRRREAPFVAINCAALPEHLLESQLFGHARGAFTDARADRAGLFVQASGGSLFLDEIGEMPLALQPKLLRALEERSVRPVGSDKAVAVDLRFIIATNKDLEASVQDGTFREDLFYRVNVVRIDLPPLRNRGDDALSLAHEFVKRAATRMNRPVRGISPAAASAIVEYAWPGNVRELQNAMERAVALTRYEELTVADLPIATERTGTVRTPTGELGALEDVERKHVIAVLEHVGWSRKRAATILKIDPKTLYRKLLAWGVEPGRPSQ
jgi:DNA-binding NtrC family response regulator